MASRRGGRAALARRRRAAPAAAVAVFIAAAALLAPGASAYGHGDAVSALKRTLYSGYRSEYSEVRERAAPRFAMDRTVRLSPGDPAKVYDPQEPFKMSFSFDHDRFLTPWVTVNDGRGVYLRYLTFEFEYAGDHIRSMRWTSEYQPPSRRGQRPENVIVRYHWKEYVERDTAFGFDVLMGVACLAAWSSAVLVLSRSNQVASRVAPVKET